MARTGKAKAEEAGQELQILELQRGTVRVAVVGTAPFIANRMSEKAKRELLFPAGKKRAAEKAQSLKHNPIEEYRASPYTLKDPDAPTLLAVLSTTLKKGMMVAALHIPGISKAQIGRLVHVEGERVPLYGVPQMFASVTRSADINRTPDVRTRAILPKWAAFFDVSFTMPELRDKGVLNLIAAAGVLSGMGDWRAEKGSGNYGTFRLAGADDPELRDIAKTGGRDAQIAAMEEPEYYDDETEELMTWFDAELERRGHKPQDVRDVRVPA